jgi:hypothetical protein
MINSDKKKKGERQKCLITYGMRYIMNPKKENKKNKNDKIQYIHSIKTFSYAPKFLKYGRD